MVLIVPFRLALPLRRRPILTPILCGISLTVGILEGVFWGRLQGTEEAWEIFLSTFGFVPAQLHWWSPLTATLLHADLPHLLFNLLVLWTLGRFVEAEGKRWDFGVLCLSGQGIALLSYFVFVSTSFPGEAQTPLVGASGIVAAICGAFFIRFPSVPVYFWVYRGGRWRRDVIVFPFSWVLLAWVGIETLQGLGILTRGQGVPTASSHLLALAFGILWALGKRWHRKALRERQEREARGAEGEKRWAEAATIWVQIATTFHDPSAWLNAAAAYLKGKDVPKASWALHQALLIPVWKGEERESAKRVATSPSITSLPPEALWDFAERLKGERCWREAVSLFEHLLTVPNFERAPLALLKVAEALWYQGDEVSARQHLHRFWVKFSHTQWASYAHELAVRWRLSTR